MTTSEVDSVFGPKIKRRIKGNFFSLDKVKIRRSYHVKPAHILSGYISRALVTSPRRYNHLLTAFFKQLDDASCYETAGESCVYGMVRCIPCRLLILALSSYFVVEHRKHVVTANIPVACSGRKRECSYQPSRRGGPRRGAQYERQRQPTAGNSLPSSMSDAANEIEPFLDNMIGLVSPYAGIHNLDLSPDSLSIVDGAQQIWGQLTPHDDSSFDSVPMQDRGSSAIRAYQSEAEMLVKKIHYSKHDRLLIGHTVPMPTIFISIHIYPCCRLQWYRSTKITLP
ncbi:hypothetical protein N7449_000757 [Penicillium cf. viridicatum]|uniref:Uncharacterized protein n=1 Tax=Penicillium cf. viridicatum TaxID=2972119 RepID=A0A9W9T8L2_9EURO|nr:hypothetical protein N7449_000757 [Penicillium cf. viridicatum]